MINFGPAFGLSLDEWRAIHDPKYGGDASARNETQDSIGTLKGDPYRQGDDAGISPQSLQGYIEAQQDRAS